MFCLLHEKEVLSMRFQRIRALALALGATALVSTADAQVNSPSLIPVPGNSPQVTGAPAYPTTGAAAWGVAPRGTMIRAISDPQPANPTPPAVPEAQVVEQAPATEGAPGCDNGCSTGCESWAHRLLHNCGDVDCCPRWYGSVAWIMMTRDNVNGVRVSNDGTPFNEVLNTRDADSGWDDGGEIKIGRRFGCDTALEMSYWSTGFLHGSATQIAAAQASGNLASPINFGTLNDGVNNVQDLFTTAVGAHFTARTNEIQNFEINLIHDSCCCGRPAMGCGCDSCGGDACGACCQPYCYSWFAGFRVFRFYENLLVAASDDNTDFVFDANEAYYDIRCHNNLFGGQLGGRFDYYAFGGKVGLWVSPRVGLYGNHISHESFLRTGNGELFDIKSYKNDVSVLGQIDAGLDYHITNRLKVFGGYRVIGATGLALSDQQIPQRVDDLAAIDAIDSNGSVIVHGAFVGLEYGW
jgi:hypothetical protein